jgi:hypothetical protein
MRAVMISAAESLETLAKRLKRRAERPTIVRRTPIGELEAEGWVGVEPAFVLSTGRCGTGLLTELLLLGGNVDVHHTPRPELVRVSKRAYEQIAGDRDMFVEVLKTAREELLLQAVRRGRTFVETNNRVTFLAPAAAAAYPDAKFIQLIRHPAAFVRSGIRRNWYSSTHDHDIGRIVPVGDDPAAAQWEHWDRFAKIAWLWNETNRFIDDFLQTLPEERRAFARAEDLFTDVATARRLLEFCGVEPPADRVIAARVRTPVNTQTSGEFPVPEEWTDEQRALLRSIATLAEHFGYDV